MIIFLFVVVLMSFLLAYLGFVNACLLSEIGKIEIENYDESKK